MVSSLGGHQPPASGIASWQTSQTVQQCTPMCSGLFAGRFCMNLPFSQVSPHTPVYSNSALFGEKFLSLDCPLLFFLSILVEQQEGKQGWLPLPLMCRAAHRAFGIPDCLPRAGACHGTHCGRHSAAQAGGPALPCLLRL